MNLIFSDEAVEQLKDTGTIIFLDKIEHDSKTLKVHAVVSAEDLGLADYPKLQSYKDLHDHFISAYEKGDFRFCLAALEHLPAMWNGHLKSYYDEMMSRIVYLQQHPEMMENWTGIWSDENQKRITQS